MHNDRLVVIGASWGGVSALRRICSGLPKDFKAPICVVQHIGAHQSILPAVLSSAGPLPAVHPDDGQMLERGKIFVARPDHHIHLDGERIRLVRGPKEHHSRPAIDPLFRSAALSFGRRTIGLVLTGLLNDGTEGMQAVKEMGGTCVIQDPSEAEAPSMPASVLKHVAVDHCVRLDEVAPLLSRLISEPVGAEATSMDDLKRLKLEEAIFLGQGDALEHLRALGSPSTFSCPDCGGTLWQTANVTPHRFRCHTGHAFTLQTLSATQSLATDEALWSSIRALQEKRMLVVLGMEVADQEGDTIRASRLREQARRLLAHADSLRLLVQDVDESTM